MSEKAKPTSDQPEKSKAAVPSAEELARDLAAENTAQKPEPAFDWMSAGLSKAAKPAEVPASNQLTEPVAPAEPVKMKPPVPGQPVEPMRPASTLPAALKTEVPTETTMLAVRPPEDEVDRRHAERAQAAETKAILPRFWQILVAVFFPFVLLLLAIRVIAMPLFAWIEYNRPGFPADSFGFNTEERVTYGSYAVDYLNNFTGPKYLAGLVGSDGRPLFGSGEVSHMVDVKGVYMIAMLAGLVLLIAMIVGIIYLAKRSVGGVRRSLFAGSAATLVIIIGLGVFALLGWERFFTDFHQLFFANGTWTFRLSDTLIRLFPEQFWTDSGGTIGVLVLLVASLTFAFSWPTKRRRELAAAAKRRPQGRRAAL
ncbi:integral membrane protein, putative [Renibacterium salmoninarum ATCC 33209]|uniref:Integral membrane protein, putative n=1 Tax=Renibacterium salmoninarum (strain ATCC 33209 / DSM 20767 / JCM 11484 / NBRC 15589 / NCIMB 2235) TaxID=288705 RepID=A9WU57_RENSM|nr:TIGR01906 family membrane protein [Renibacterium salmoninarum]ABY24728.1 integral membrane protein, putative [Renibacterium salmoninarum ATCC 33209]